MSDVTIHTETPMASRDALDTLASTPVDELRRLAVRLDEETRIVRSLLRERSRRARGRCLDGAGRQESTPAPE
jgi:hypothetical protein